MKLDQLPEELYTAILEMIPNLEERKSCTVALSQALPRSPVPFRWIYNEIRLTTSRSISLLYQHLRRCGGIRSVQAQWVESLASEVWDADAQILADLFGILPNVRKVALSVGTTFAPEHLEEMFHNPRPELLSLSITFRPYVQIATYYQFLKGAYFDSLLEKLSNWPSTCKLKYLSIVQTLPPSPTLFQSFAQPIVFFSLDPIARLMHSSSISNTTHIRIQVPARPIAQFLTNPSPSPSPSPTPSHPGTPVPYLAQASPTNQSLGRTTFLDLSTTHLSATHLTSLFSRFPALTHLVLDNTALLSRSTEIAAEFADLGRQLAMAGIKRAKDRERSIKALITAIKLAKQVTGAHTPPRGGVGVGGAAADLSESSPLSPQAVATQLGMMASKTKRGRRGVATAKFSLREKADPGLGPVPSNLPIAPIDIGYSELSIPLLEKIRIVPLFVPLQSLCLTTFAVPTAERIREWEAEFAKGWRVGASAVRGMRRQIAEGVGRDLVRPWKFSDGRLVGGKSEGGGGGGGEGEGEGGGGMEGLVELSKEEWEAELEMVDILGIVPPRLCFAGRADADGSVAHADGCAHGV